MERPLIFPLFSQLFFYFIQGVAIALEESEKNEGEFHSRKFAIQHCYQLEVFHARHTSAILPHSKDLRLKKKRRPFCAVNFKKFSMLIFDGISYESIHIIKKRHPTVRHTSINNFCVNSSCNY